MVGLHHSPIDVKAAYDYLVSSNKIEGNLYLVGHSMGAYGVATSLSLGVECDGVITFAGYESSRDELFYGAASLIGGVAYATTPAFDLGMMATVGSSAWKSASASLIESGIPALVIQGDKDEAVMFDQSSIYCHVKNQKNIATMLREGMTHSGPWRTLSSLAKYQEFTEWLETEPSEEEIQAHCSDFDRLALSDIDPLVSSAMLSFLSETA